MHDGIGADENVLALAQVGQVRPDPEAVLAVIGDQVCIEDVVAVRPKVFKNQSAAFAAPPVTNNPLRAAGPVSPSSSRASAR